MLYVGTYTSGESKGIYRLHLDPATGALSPAGEPTETVNPSFLAFHPSRRFLYAVNETGDAPTDTSGGGQRVRHRPRDRRPDLPQPAALRRRRAVPRDDRQGGPARLRRQLLGRHRGGAPDPGGRAPGAAEPRHPPPGPQSRSPSASAEPHPHSIDLDPANRFAFVADLGLDKVVAYRVRRPKRPARAPRGGDGRAWPRARGRVISPSIPTGGRRT